LTLAARSPREFVALVESCKNRLVRWLGDRRQARMLGQVHGLNPRAVMDAGEVVLVDLSSLAYSDAAFDGTLVTSMFVAAARRRTPGQARPHRIIIDEAESMLTVETARATDQTAKWGLTFLNIIQRLGQLRQRDDFIADALLVNSGFIAVFGGLEPESAAYMAEHLWAAHVNYQQWKSASVRPVAIGNRKVELYAQALARHHADQSATAVSHTHASASSRAVSHGTSAAWGSMIGSGETHGLSLMPGGVIEPPTTLAHSQGQSASRNRSAIAASSHALVAARQHAQAHGESKSIGHADGWSQIIGRHEAYVTEYRDMPTIMWSLEETRHKLAGELMALPRRECIVSIEHAAPVRLRTPDLEPAFASAEFQRLVVPLFMQKITASSRYARANTDIDAELATRVDHLLAIPIDEPDLAQPEPMPPIDEAVDFAASFWARRQAPTDSPAPPVGKRFRVVDGGKSHGDNDHDQ
jgi:hypothetical protein